MFFFFWFNCLRFSPILDQRPQNLQHSGKSYRERTKQRSWNSGYAVWCAAAVSAALDTGLCLLLLLPFADLCGNDSETKCPACYWKSERLLVEHCLNGETEDGAGFLHSDPEKTGGK